MQNLPAAITYETIWDLAVSLAGRTSDNVPEGESVMLQSFFASQLEDLWGKEAWPELCDNLMQVLLQNNAFANPYTVNLIVSGAANGSANGTYTTLDNLTWTNAASIFIITQIGGLWTISEAGVPVYTLNNTTPAGSNWVVVPPWVGPAPTSVFSTISMGDILGLYSLDPRTVDGWHRFESSRWLLGNGQVYVDTHLNSVWVDFQLPCPDLLDPTLVGQVNEAALMAVTLPRRFRNPLAFRAAAMLLAVEDPALADKYTQMAELELLRQAAHLNQPWWRVETGRR